MGPLDPSLERIFLGIAHALFMNRLHLLRLTEIVRLNVQPDKDDAQMILPRKLDDELKQQAIDYVLTCFPPEWGTMIHEAKAGWLQPI